jgi:hypothetical protein
MKKHPELSVEIFTLEGLKSLETEPTSGWGAGTDAQKTILKGQVVEIIVSKDDEPYVGLRILEDGSLILTGYRARFTQPVDSNLSLKSIIPWKE